MPSPAFVSFLVLIALAAAILIGGKLRHFLPEKRVNDETKDTIKLAVGLIATMTALVLGLLVSSAKGSYDAERLQVIQMSAKAAVLSRVLALYGSEANDVRRAFHASMEEAIAHIWPEGGKANLNPNTTAGDAVYFKIEALTPTNAAQEKLKGIAESTATDLAQERALLVAQSESAISVPMLVVVVSWLIVIFSAFSLLAPSNHTALTALMISALAVAGAIFLLLELDQPFDGLIKIPSREMKIVADQLPH